MIEEHAKISNKLLANKIMENLKNLVHGLGSKDSGSNSKGKMTPQRSENTVGEESSFLNLNSINPQNSVIQTKLQQVNKNNKTLLNFQEDEITLNTTSIIPTLQPFNNVNNTLLLNNLANNHSTQPLPINKANIQPQSAQNKFNVQQDTTSTSRNVPTLANFNSNQTMQLHQDPEITNEFLGKKINRDPNTEEKKILLKKHNMGNISCDQIALSDEKYDDDIKMIINFANEGHPFQIVIQFCQKFKWPMPEIDTFAVKNNDNPEVPIFKTTISVKSNTFKGEATGHTKKSSKSKNTLKF
jgi:hypothetical protein